MATARPTVQIYSSKDKEKIVGSTPLPEVFQSPIRNDIIRFVHTNMAKNARQAYAVTRRAGHRTTAESWGTGRAVARIPRVSGGGTNRSGQGAYGNMCRGGRMFAPTKVFRRWHRHVNKNQRRYAACSAIAASGVPALVMARGHRIDNIAEIPFVVDDECTTIKKTKDATKFLKSIHAIQDIEKVVASKNVRPGKGKWRNRRYVSRKGPLLIFAGKAGASVFRNIYGMDTANVNYLNLLQLAPGGHLGRFIIWTKSAFEQLNNIFGTRAKKSAIKTGFSLPISMVSTSDITKIINSAEIQKQCRPKRQPHKYNAKSTNPLRNASAMGKLNPLAAVDAHNKLRLDTIRQKNAARRFKDRRAAIAKRRQTIAPKKSAPGAKKAAPKAAAPKAAAPKAAAPKAAPKK